MKTLGMGDFSKVAAGIYLEGLSVDYQRDVIWYSDVIAGGIHGVMSDGRVVASFNEGRMWTGGIMMNEDGAVLSSGQGGIMWNHPDSGKSGWLLEHIDDKPINGINEMMPDGTGGIFFGTNDIEMVIAGKQARPSAIYRLTRDRQVLRLADGFSFSNGIMFSAVRRTLYCNDTFACTYAFDVLPDLTLANKRVFLKKDDADGLALDMQGNAWITGFRSSHLTRVRPDGSLLPSVSTPAGAISQIRFGGVDMCDYYFTAVPADGGDNLKDGKPLTEKNSFIYRGRSQTAGMPIAAAGFDLG